MTFDAERQARIFDTTLSAIADFAYAFDRDGRFLCVNRALLDLWGLELHETVGKNFFDLQYPEDLAARLQRQVQTVVDTGERVTDETPYTSPTGAGGYYEYIFTPVLDADGAVEVVAGSTRDITTRKQMEDELRAVSARLETALADQVQARRTAEDAVQAREEFMSVASHELRNPVATIFGTTQLIGRALADGTLDADRLARYVTALESSGAQLARLTDDLLDVSRLQHGNVTLRPETRDVVGLVRDLLAREPWTRHDIRFAAADTITARIDVDRIEQIVANLLDNAVKYSPDGGSVAVRVREADESVFVEVEDHGVGLANGAAGTIFEPFGRVLNQDGSSVPGLGLGLYLSRGIARQHGGELTARSEGPGHGTTMSLRLPIAGPDPAHHKPGHADRRRAASDRGPNI